MRWRRCVRTIRLALCAISRGFWVRLSSRRSGNSLRCRLMRPISNQDALAPMRQDNSFSFVRDFERLLGEAFFKKVRQFTSMQTDAADLEAGLVRYLEVLASRAPIDILFLGMGPEAGG